MPVDKLLSEQEIEQYHEMLIQRRREVVGDLEHLEDEVESSAPQGANTRMPTHPADAALDTRADDMSLRLSESAVRLVREIDDAIERIRSGSYGLCEVDGEPIARARLEVEPWARYCKDHAEQEESGDTSGRLPD